MPNKVMQDEGSEEAERRLENLQNHLIYFASTVGVLKVSLNNYEQGNLIYTLDMLPSAISDEKWVGMTRDSAFDAVLQLFRNHPEFNVVFSNISEHDTQMKRLLIAAKNRILYKISQKDFDYLKTFRFDAAALTSENKDMFVWAGHTFLLEPVPVTAYCPSWEEWDEPSDNYSINFHMRYEHGPGGQSVFPVGITIRMGPSGVQFLDVVVAANIFMVKFVEQINSAEKGDDEEESTKGSSGNTREKTRRRTDPSNPLEGEENVVKSLDLNKLSAQYETLVINNSVNS